MEFLFVQAYVVKTRSDRWILYDVIHENIMSWTITV